MKGRDPPPTALDIGDGLQLPLDAVTQTLVVYGGKGMGKTNFGAVLAEELARSKQRFSFLDPVGVAWGLQHSANGKSPGVELVALGGVHGDLPIEPTAGAIVADFVADESVNTLIDISRRPSGTMWSAGEKTRFVADYCARLYERQGESRRPVMQIIDEAGRFVPQQIPHGAVDLARCVGAIEQLVELGRNAAIGVCLITQRSARMNKSVSELAECMIAFRTVGPRSIAAILDWLGDHVEKERWNSILEQLRKLPRGEALVVSPGWLQLEAVVAVRKRHTFDSSNTPDASSRAVPEAASKPDLGKYRERMAETIRKALEDDPKTLRARIAELERQAAARPAAATTPAPERVEVLVPLVPPREDIAKIESAVAQLRAAGSELEVFADRFERMLIDGGRMAGTFRQIDHARCPPPDFVGAARRLANAGHELPRAAPRNGEPRADVQEQTGREKRILNALAELEALGVPQPERIQVALLAGYTNLTSKGLVNALGSLRTAGLIEYPGPGTVELTDQGRGLAAPASRPRSAAEVQGRVVSLLGGAAQRILQPLLDVYPKSMARPDAAAAAGYTNVTSKGFANALGRLSSLGLVRYPSSGQVAAAPVLFLET